MSKKYLILAGGESSRFNPFNELHKSFFILGGKRIIERTIESLLEDKDVEIVVVLGSNNYQEEKKILEGLDNSKNIKIVEQKSPKGQADAILSAREHLGGDFYILNAHHLNFINYKNDFEKVYSKGSYDVVTALTETDRPWDYGVVRQDNEVVLEVVEKPEKGKEPSNKRIVGMYMTSEKFLDLLEKYRDKQYGLEDCLDKIAKNRGMGSVEIKNLTPSIKYPWDLFAYRDLCFKDSLDIHKTAEIAETATVRGNVRIGKNARVFDYALIEGPIYIGDDCVIGAYSQVRGNTILENGTCLQRYVDVKNSLIGENSSVHSGFIGDSIVGSNVKIGAGFITANKRLDRKSVGAVVRDKKIASGLTGLGCLIGNNAKLGIRVSTMPGAIIKAKQEVMPGEIVK